MTDMERALLFLALGTAEGASARFSHGFWLTVETALTIFWLAASLYFFGRGVWNGLRGGR